MDGWMGWDGMGWDGMGWNGMEWNGWSDLQVFPHAIAGHPPIHVISALHKQP